uniref:Putative secreted protein n=1 Tax=Anopheles darlingi TaxID=43151 RepID=A0A2M4DN58_ANODA
MSPVVVALFSVASTVAAVAAVVGGVAAERGPALVVVVAPVGLTSAPRSDCCRYASVVPAVVTPHHRTHPPSVPYPRCPADNFHPRAATEASRNRNPNPAYG